MVGVLYKDVELMTDEHVQALRSTVNLYETILHPGYIGREYPLQHVKRLVIRHSLDAFLTSDECRSVIGQIMYVNAFESGRHHCLFPQLERIRFSSNIVTTVSTINTLQLIDLLSVLARPLVIELVMGHFGHDVWFPHAAFKTPFGDRLGEITVHVKEPPKPDMPSLVVASAYCPCLRLIRFIGSHFNIGPYLARVSHPGNNRHLMEEHILHPTQTIQYLIHAVWNRRMLSDKLNEATVEIHLVIYTWQRSFQELRSDWFHRVSRVLRQLHDHQYFRLNPSVWLELPRTTIEAYEKLRLESLDKFDLPIRFIKEQ